jgi:hypothetical protein
MRERHRATDAELAAIATEYAAIVRSGAPLPDDKSAHAKGAVSTAGIASERWGISREGAYLRLRLIARRGFDGPIRDAIAERKAADNARTPLGKIPARLRGQRVLLLTAAQDETPLHDGFWANLQAYAAARDAEIFVGGFTYQKGLFEDHSVRAGVYADAIVPLLRPAEIRLAPRLLWCGQANVLPTAANPLAGWETHGGESDIVLPHAKIALTSAPTRPGCAGKIAFSTGVVTRPNYVRRNAGMKAEWHHTIGFAIAEIGADGWHYVRTVSAEGDGSFNDLDWRAENGVATHSHAVEAIVWGDIHHEKIEPAMSRIGWGIDPDGLPTEVLGEAMVDALRPAHQVFHDLIDFAPRNHHNRADPVFLTSRHAARAESVEAEIAAAGRWLAAASRPFARTVVVNSNHDEALLKWLRSPDGRMDPANADYWHRLNGRWHTAARAGAADWHPFERELRAAAPGLKFKFVRMGESHIIGAGAAAIECGLHGHIGPRGARGSLAAFARVAPRVCVGHVHAPGIREGAWAAGVNSRLALGYNHGPGDWAWADIVIQKSGKRQLVIKTKDGWRG